MTQETPRKDASEIAEFELFVRLAIKPQDVYNHQKTSKKIIEDAFHEINDKLKDRLVGFSYSDELIIESDYHKLETLRIVSNIFVSSGWHVSNIWYNEYLNKSCICFRLES